MNIAEHKKFWSELAANRLADVHANTGLKKEIANQFYLGTAHMLKLIDEYEAALSMSQWSFYRIRAATLERQIITGKA